MSASIATTTCTGWAPLIVAAVQGYSAWKPQELCETAEAALVNACTAHGCFLALRSNGPDGDFIESIPALLLAVSGEAILWVPRLLRFDPCSTRLNHETGFLFDLPIMADSVSTGFYGPLETGSYPPKLTRENK